MKPLQLTPAQAEYYRRIEAGESPVFASHINSDGPELKLTDEGREALAAYDRQQKHEWPLFEAMRSWSKTHQKDWRKVLKDPKQLQPALVAAFEAERQKWRQVTRPAEESTYKGEIGFHTDAVFYVASFTRGGFYYGFRCDETFDFGRIIAENKADGFEVLRLHFILGRNKGRSLRTRLLTAKDTVVVCTRGKNYTLHINDPRTGQLKLRRVFKGPVRVVVDRYLQDNPTKHMWDVKF
jgi:hypothetical protein